MKTLLFTFFMFLPAYAIDKNPSDYAIDQQDLVEVRMRWVGSESRIRQLMFEAKHIAKEVPCHYFCDGKGHVADFDAKNQTVTTYFFRDKKQKAIVQSYDEFIAFINDQRLIAFINDHLLREKSVKTPSIFKLMKRLWCFNP